MASLGNVSDDALSGSDSSSDEDEEQLFLQAKAAGRKRPAAAASAAEKKAGPPAKKVKYVFDGYHRPPCNKGPIRHGEAFFDFEPMTHDEDFANMRTFVLVSKPDHISQGWTSLDGALVYSPSMAVDKHGVASKSLLEQTLWLEEIENRFDFRDPTTVEAQIKWSATNRPKFKGPMHRTTCMAATNDEGDFRLYPVTLSFLEAWSLNIGMLPATKSKTTTILSKSLTNEQHINPDGGQPFAGGMKTPLSFDVRWKQARKKEEQKSTTKKGKPSAAAAASNGGLTKVAIANAVKMGTLVMASCLTSTLDKLHKKLEAKCAAKGTTMADEFQTWRARLYHDLTKCAGTNEADKFQEHIRGVEKEATTLEPKEKMSVIAYRTAVRSWAATHPRGSQLLDQQHAKYLAQAASHAAKEENEVMYDPDDG